MQYEHISKIYIDKKFKQVIIDKNGKIDLNNFCKQEFENEN